MGETRTRNIFGGYSFKEGCQWGRRKGVGGEGRDLKRG